MSRAKSTAGFTLIEVIIALGIMAMTLGVLLEVQGASLMNVGRARDMTVATLLARSKMVDIEQELLDEGYTLGIDEDEGDFADDGWKAIKWASRVSELEMDLSSMGSLCDGLGGDADDGASGDGAGCGELLGGAGAFGGAIGSLTESIGRSIRLIELTVSWPAGRFSESVSFRQLVTPDRFGVERPRDRAPEDAAAQAAELIEKAAGAVGAGKPGGQAGNAGGRSGEPVP